MQCMQPAEIFFLGESFGGLGGEVDFALKKFGQSRVLYFLLKYCTFFANFGFGIDEKKHTTKQKP